MRILMLGSGSYTSTLSIRLRALAQHLSNTHEVTVMVPSADKYNNFTPEKELNTGNVKLVRPWQPKTHSAMFNLVPYLFTSCFEMIRRRHDLIYLYKPTPITLIGLLPRLIFGQPIILDLDDLGSEVMKQQGQSALQSRLVAFCERIAIKHASAIVVASTYLRTWVQSQTSMTPILLLPNGVEPSEYMAVKEGTPRKAIDYFGALNRLSLIQSLLESLPAVLKAIPDAHITIAGGGSALDEAKQFVQRLGIERMVTFTGWIDMLAVQHYTQFADIAICCQPDIPTVRAASNMKVFQYMAMQSVPIVSDVGDLAAYVKAGEAGIVVPADDTKALAKAIIELLQQPDRRARIAKYARSLAEYDYSWAHLSAQLDSFLQTIKKG